MSSHAQSSAWYIAGAQYLLDQQMNPITSSTLAARGFCGIYHPPGETWLLHGTQETMRQPNEAGRAGCQPPAQPAGLRRKSEGSEALVGPGLRPGRHLRICWAKIRLAQVGSGPV